MSERRITDFHISHAPADRAWAEWIVWELEEAGHTTTLESPGLGASTIAVLSPAYLESEHAVRELQEARERESTGHSTLPIRVAEMEYPALLGTLGWFDLVGLGEEEARTQLLQRVATVLAGPATAQARPTFPRPPAARPVERPAQFPSELPHYVAVSLDIRLGDILDFPADVVAFKHAEGFHGADRAAARRLGDAGVAAADLSAQEGQVRRVESRGALAAPTALFVGVGPLLTFKYEHLRRFSRELVGACREIPGARHVATTLHGPGFGLDEREAFLAQMAGILNALQEIGSESEIERITIVERDAQRLDLLGMTLQEHLAEIPYASLAGHSADAWRFDIGAQAVEEAHSPGDPQPRPIKLLERTPDSEAHVFIAYPFELKDHARFGLERPAQSLGYLTRLIGDQAYIGDALQRIKEQIDTATFVIAVLTQANPNVFLEVGYAWGRGRPTLLVAQEDERLMFDVRGQRIIRYRDITDLETKFIAEVTELKPEAVV